MGYFNTPEYKTPGDTKTSFSSESYTFNPSPDRPFNIFTSKVLETFAEIYQLNKTLDTETSPVKASQDQLVHYLIDINPHMFFSVENIEYLANNINTNEHFRSIVFNLTDISLIKTIDCDIDYLDDLVHVVDSVMCHTKITDDTKVIYDARLISGSCLDQDNLVEVITHNPFILVLYVLAMNKVSLLKVVTEI